MRTTVEIADRHRAKLLELAARRGEKGFSRLISEAVEAYLKAAQHSESQRRAAIKLRGSLSSREAARLHAETLELRRTWR